LLSQPTHNTDKVKRPLACRIVGRATLSTDGQHGFDVGISLPPLSFYSRYPKGIKVADPDLFDIFIRNQVYLQYTQDHLAPSQIDAVDAGNIPGYTP